MRLIDAIELKNKMSTQIGAIYHKGKMTQKLYDKIIELIDKADVFTFESIIIPKLRQDAKQWYSIKKKEPPANSSVLCYYLYDNGNGAMGENYYYGKGAWSDQGRYVAFWRELPLLPNEIIERFKNKDMYDEEHDSSEGDDNCGI